VVIIKDMKLKNYLCSSSLLIFLSVACKSNSEKQTEIRDFATSIKTGDTLIIEDTINTIHQIELEDSIDKPKAVKPKIVEQYNKLDTNKVDKTGPWVSDAEVLTQNNKDMIYVRFPKKREVDSVRLFENRRRRYIKTLGSEKIREIDSVSWEVWQVVLKQRHRYYTYQPFNYLQWQKKQIKGN
jgi:hypothetical protein